MMKMKNIKKICVYLFVLTMIIVITPIKFKASGNDSLVKLSLLTDTPTVRVGDRFYVDVIVDASVTNGIDQIVSSIEWSGDYIRVVGMGMIPGTGWTTINKAGTIQSVMGSVEESAHFKIFHEQYHSHGSVIRITFQAERAVSNLNIGFGDYQMLSGDNEINNEAEVRNLNMRILPSSSSNTAISYEVDYINHQLIITNGNNTKLYLGVVSSNNTVKNIETFLLNPYLATTKINLSSFSAKKDWTLRIYGDTDVKETDIVLAKSPKKVKAVYEPIKKTVSERIQFTADNVLVELSKLEFRTESSAWSNATELTVDYLDSCSVFGATFIFRMKAVKNESLCSAETKVKIPKARNAPKAVLNYSKLTVKLPAKTEYRTSVIGNWQEVSDVLLNVNDIIDITMKDFYLEVRYMADSKKPESKIAVYEVGKQIDGPLIEENGLLQIHSTSNDRGQTEEISIINASTREIEYIIAESNTNINSINLNTQRWKKLKANDEVKLIKSEANGKIIIARYAAINTRDSEPQFASKLVKSELIIWNQ